MITGKADIFSRDNALYIATLAVSGWILPTKPYGRGGYLGLTEADTPNGGVLYVPLEPEALGEAIRSCLAISIAHPA